MGRVEEIRQALHNHLNVAMKDFAYRYRNLLSHQIEFNPNDAIASLQSTLTAVQATPYEVYLLIDEYDNFANEVLMAQQQGSRQRYEALIEGEGMLKTLFKAIKLGTEGQGIDRVFITGVSPVVMSDVTSGFNIAENIYLRPEYNDLCGFAENELKPILHQVVEQCDDATDRVEHLLMMLRTFYNGYCFSPRSRDFIYNPTLVFYFLKYYQHYCLSPEEMLDENLAMDRGKLAYIAQLPKGEQLMWDTLKQEQPLAIEQLARRFGVADVLAGAKDTRFLVSLLYYFGVLTLTTKRTPYGEPIFQIPNLVVRGLYAERIQAMLLPTGAEIDEARRVTKLLYQQGQIEPLCDFIEQHQFRVFDNRDYQGANELVVKTLFLALLFNDIFYIMDSEPALARGYGDLIMLVRPDKRQYQLLDILIEFKYVGLGQIKLTGEQVQQASREELGQLEPVKAALAEAKQQLSRYEQTLAAIYGDLLRLRTYTVVAVGYDRLVWQ